MPSQDAATTPTPILPPTPPAMRIDATQELERLHLQVAELSAANAQMKEAYHAELRQQRDRILLDAAAASKSKRIEVAKPDCFDGSESKLDGFLHALLLVFRAEPNAYADDDARITYTLSYMKAGRAQAWARRFMEKHGHCQSYFYSWNDFTTLLRESFGTADPTVVAVDKLRKLHQGSMSADEYIVAFEEQEAYTGWDDKALKDQFELGLKPGLTASIYRLSDMPEDLAGWKAWARKLDRQWRQYEEKQHLHKASRTPVKMESRADSKPESKRADAAGSTFRNPLDVATRRDSTGMTFGGRGQPMDLDEARQKGLCFRCGQKGHLSRLCPNRNRAEIRRMVASLDKDQVDELRKVLNTVEEDPPEEPEEDFLRGSQ